MRDLWDSARGYVRVVLQDVQTEAHVGLHAWERHAERPSRLIINVEMFAHDDGVRRDTPATIIDYDGVRAALRAWPQRPHVELLETLLEEIVGLCFASPRVEACRVSIVKPDIFNEAAAAGVEVYRLRPA